MLALINVVSTLVQDLVESTHSVSALITHQFAAAHLALLEMHSSTVLSQQVSFALIKFIYKFLF